MHLKVAGKPLWDEHGLVKIRNNEKLPAPDSAFCVIDYIFSFSSHLTVLRA